MTLHRGGAPAETMAPPAQLPSETIRPKDWTDVPYPSSATIIDGVAYTESALRELVRQRHELAMDVALWRGFAERRQIEIEQLKRRLERADNHLRLRTAALVRVIARTSGRKPTPPAAPHAEDGA